MIINGCPRPSVPSWPTWRLGLVSPCHSERSMLILVTSRLGHMNWSHNSLLSTGSGGRSTACRCHCESLKQGCSSCATLGGTSSFCGVWALSVTHFLLDLTTVPSHLHCAADAKKPTTFVSVSGTAVRLPNSTRRAKDRTVVEFR